MGFMDTLTLPPEMTRLDQWLCWKPARRNGKTTKIPVDAKTGGNGKANDPETWASYEVAQACVDENDGWGLGFVFTEDDDLVGIDLDDVRDPETGEMTDSAEDIIDILNSYTEISPSGTGFHVIVQGALPSGRNRKDDIEMYEDGRFFTVTGNRLPGTEPGVKPRDGPLYVAHHKYVADDEKDKQPAADPNAGPDISLDDEEILTKAKNSRNGKKFEALWGGLTSGYDSHSEADLALCSYLAFWTSGDAQQMDDLFRQSGLFRPKWDNEHSSDGTTYGEMTINKAIQTSTSFYSGSSE